MIFSRGQHTIGKVSNVTVFSRSFWLVKPGLEDVIIEGYTPTMTSVLELVPEMLSVQSGELVPKTSFVLNMRPKMTGVSQ
jgi:hypothetical protein